MRSPHWISLGGLGLEEFLGLLTHELRNPLSPVINGLHILELAANDAVQVREIAQIMKRQADQLVQLIDQLADLSRLGRGKAGLKTEEVDLALVLREAIDSVRGRLQQRRIVLTLPQAGAGALVVGDRVRTRQALVHLFGLVCRQLPQGGRLEASVHLRDELGVLRIHAGPDNPSCTVASQGEDASPGRSLELVLARALVEWQDGELLWSSHCDDDIDFEVRLPVATHSAAKRTEPTAVAPRPGSESLQVLVVEDTRAIAEIFSRLLRALGHDVRIATDAEKALDELSRFCPDVIFSDITMPGMDGYELARELRRRPELKKTTLVAMTGSGQPDVCEQSLKSGFDHYILKPADIAVLRTLLDSVNRNRTPDPVAAPSPGSC